MASRIMVVDDEHEIADLIEVYLNNEGFMVYKFYCSRDALDCAAKTELDLAILDVMMPDIDGFTVCRIIRESRTYPIIMLTAKEQEIDKITGLTLGADDYVTKPFRPLELIARVKAQLRRYKRYNQSQADRESIITYSGLMLDKNSHECTLNEIPLCLTPCLLYTSPSPRDS